MEIAAVIGKVFKEKNNTTKIHHMNTIANKVDQFFDAYEARFNDALAGNPNPDIEGTINAFASCFIEAGPLGLSCGKNDNQFREAIPKGYEFYKSIGTKKMKIASKQLTVLDDYHVMVKVSWESIYIKNNNQTEIIEFDVFYFLQTVQPQFKIFAYITGDEQKILKEKGLLPPKS